MKDVDAHLDPGDVIEVAGVNGAGKSTLLRLLAGLTKPSSGTITDRPAVVGFAPDRFPLEQPFTVSGYLRHMSRIRGGARWEPWAERLGMAHLLGLRLGELSKGSAHKVGLTQALMCGPGLLILDEPFAGLDADTREVLPSIVTELSEGGAIVVASDHQGGLRHLPSIRHWTVVDGLVKEGTAGQRATVRVDLPVDEVRSFVARMRDEGYRVQDVSVATSVAEVGHVAEVTDANVTNVADVTEEQR
ncbi:MULTISPECIES: ATP-binding cassette domain-containing protein [unclassified Nonomuraea]|uniref:ATP-binding cassette domain-containing protein n=1 Tax=unclassified Nonomuraea TaxID=2593643 RepID=UPI0033EDAA0A